MLAVGRVVNVAVPLTLGGLLETLEQQFGSGQGTPQGRSFWPYLLAYMGLRFLQGSGGLGALRDVSLPFSGSDHQLIYPISVSDVMGSCHAIF